MSVLTLAQAKGHLNLNLADSAIDVELQAMVDAAEAAIGQRCGPLASTATTVRVSGGPALMLPVTPALSLSSVTPVGGTAITLSDLHLEGPAGLVTYNYGGTFPDRYYDVVYNAGRTTCPADLLMAVRELVRHMWKTQRGPTRRPGSEPSEAFANTVPGAAHMLPFRVSELISPHIQPGFA